MAFPVGWSLLAKFTIDNTKVSGTGDLTGFPVLLMDTNFDPNVYANCDDGGGDLRFSSDEAGTAQLPCEVVSFNTATSTSQVWVKRTLDGDADTIIYIWGDKTGETQPAAGDAYGSENVWDSGFAAVWHFEQAPTNNALDSTGNDNDLVPEGMTSANATVARIGNGIQMDGTGSSDDYKLVNAGQTGMANTTYTTLSCWIYPHAVNGAQKDFFTKGANEFANRSSKLSSLSNNDAWWDAGNLAANQWQYISLTWDGTAAYNQVNSLVTSTTTANLKDLPVFGTEDLYVGVYPGNDVTRYDGVIDEMRISFVARSYDWQVTEINNISSATTFGAAASIAGSTPATPATATGFMTTNTKFWGF